MGGVDRVAGSSPVWHQRSFPVRLSSATMKSLHHDGLAVRRGRGACAQRVARLHVAGVFLPLEMAFHVVAIQPERAEAGEAVVAMVAIVRTCWRAVFGQSGCPVFRSEKR